MTLCISLLLNLGCMTEPFIFWDSVWCDSGWQSKMLLKYLWTPLPESVYSYVPLLWYSVRVSGFWRSWFLLVSIYRSFKPASSGPTALFKLASSNAYVISSTVISLHRCSYSHSYRIRSIGTNFKLFEFSFSIMSL